MNSVKTFVKTENQSTSGVAQVNVFSWRDFRVSRISFAL